MKENEPLTFNELVNLISIDLTLNLDLNTIRSTLRRVQNNENSQITVPIGQNTRIKLNYLDLVNIYTSTIQNNRIYNKQICENVLPTMTRNHGCTVHVVGMIFVRIGVMRIVDDRNYEII